MNDASVRGRVIICNQRGLHARAAAKLVKLAGAFDAEVTIRANGSEVPGSSIMGFTSCHPCRPYRAKSCRL